MTIPERINCTIGLIEQFFTDPILRPKSWRELASFLLAAWAWSGQ